ncbi:MAG: YfhO family protein, partial [Bacteroidales bacterium]
LIHTPKSKIVFNKINYIMNFGNWRPVAHLFYYLLGFYILLLVFRVKPWLSMAGATAFGFSSYLFIIIAAGHVTKAIALGYMAPVIAGVYLAYDRKPFWGMMLMTFFLILQILTGHLQIVYYTAMTAFILVIFYLVDAIRKKHLPRFLKTSAILLAGAVISVGANATHLLTTYEYGEHSIRGKSDLSTAKENRTTGLDRDYIVQWSYGKGETFTLLVPNFKGGPSGGSVGRDSETYRVMKKYLGDQAGSVTKQMPMYFGKQPFTSGPVYVGAFVFFLFIFGLFLVRGKIKWWLLIATVLSIFLAWGKNMMWFTDIFLDFLPGYNKFRTVSMILVIAEFAMPLLGFLAIKELFKKTRDNKRIFNALKISGALVVGFLLIVIAAPGISNPETDKDGQLVEQIFQGTEDNPQYQQMKQRMMDEYVPALHADRKSMVRKDALRSLFFVLLGISVVYLIYRRKIKPELAYALLFLIVIVDLWPVNRRYLNEDNFVPERQVKTPFIKSKADRQILKDKDEHYRVANLSVSLFNDASTSWFHKSIGGYHGAKMRRYQELYDSLLMFETRQAQNLANFILQSEEKAPDQINGMFNSNFNSVAFDMLNTKYFIAHPKAPPIKNYTACGNAWFVKDYSLVDDADEEITKLKHIDPHEEIVVDDRFEEHLEELSGIMLLCRYMIVVDDRFEEHLEGFDPEYDSTANISLTYYSPDKLIYNASAEKEQLAVFSEIYYPHGWKSFVDGEEVPHFRANYVLRSMRVPAGKHEIEFRFEPKSYYTGNKISHASSIVFFLLLLGGLFMEFRKAKAKNK